MNKNQIYITILSWTCFINQSFLSMAPKMPPLSTLPPAASASLSPRTPRSATYEQPTITKISPELMQEFIAKTQQVTAPTVASFISPEEINYLAKQQLPQTTQSAKTQKTPSAQATVNMLKSMTHKRTSRTMQTLPQKEIATYAERLSQPAMQEQLLQQQQRNQQEPSTRLPQLKETIEIEPLEQNFIEITAENSIPEIEFIPRETLEILPVLPERFQRRPLPQEQQTDTLNLLDTQNLQPPLNTPEEQSIEPILASSMDITPQTQPDRAHAHHANPERNTLPQLKPHTQTPTSPQQIVKEIQEILTPAELTTYIEPLPLQPVSRPQRKSLPTTKTAELTNQLSVQSLEPLLNLPQEQTAQPILTNPTESTPQSPPARAQSTFVATQVSPLPQLQPSKQRPSSTTQLLEEIEEIIPPLQPSQPIEPLSAEPILKPQRKALHKESEQTDTLTLNQPQPTPNLTQALSAEQNPEQTPIITTPHQINRTKKIDLINSKKNTKIQPTAQNYSPRNVAPTNSITNQLISHTPTFTEKNESMAQPSQPLTSQLTPERWNPSYNEQILPTERYEQPSMPSQRFDEFENIPQEIFEYADFTPTSQDNFYPLREERQDTFDTKFYQELQPPKEPTSDTHTQISSPKESLSESIQQKTLTPATKNQPDSLPENLNAQQESKTSQNYLAIMFFVITLSMMLTAIWRFLR